MERRDGVGGGGREKGRGGGALVSYISHKFIFGSFFILHCSDLLFIGGVLYFNKIALSPLSLRFFCLFFTFYDNKSTIVGKVETAGAASAWFSTCFDFVIWKRLVCDIVRVLFLRELSSKRASSCGLF